MCPSLNDQLEALPHAPGVYLFKDARGKILYVGKASSLRSRVRSYFNAGADRSLWIGQMLRRVVGFDSIVTRSEKEALILEGNLIKMHKPHFNVRFKDDKRFPYLKLTLRDQWPALLEVRTPKDDGAAYFGPFSNAGAMRQTVSLVKRVFGVRAGVHIADRKWAGCPWRDTRKPLDKPCLEFHIQRCIGPCVGAVSAEAYRAACEQTRLFLEGRQEVVVRQLRTEMRAAALRLEFELAGRLRDQARAVERVLESQQVVSLANEDQDVLAVYSESGIASVALLVVRSGKLIGDQHFMLQAAEGRSDAEILGAFVKQHYGNPVQTPRELLLPVRLDDTELLGDWLTERRGAKCDVLTPERGRKRKLVELATHNATLALREMMAREEVELRATTQTLTDLQSRLNLPVLPRRIECFDISHVQGKQAYASMVVFEDGRAAKREYRKFRIKTTDEEPDDYQSMREALGRRLQRALDGDPKFARLPDLLLVDGGAGQLGCALEALAAKQLDHIPSAGLAKEHELLHLPLHPAPLMLPRNSPALHLLQRLRDEAHRFALSAHRMRRGKVAVHSVLDDIPGIGPRRKLSLLAQFGSVKRLLGASVEELAAVPDMNRRAAEKLQEYLRLVGRGA